MALTKDCARWIYVSDWHSRVPMCGFYTRPTELPDLLNADELAYQPMNLLVYPLTHIENALFPACGHS